MDSLVAPWRIDWVKRDDPDTDDGCVFCRLPDETTDRENRILARSDHCFVLLNNYPYNPGHAMVIPYSHGGEYETLSDEVLLDHGRLTQRTLRALREAMAPHAFNTGLNLGGPAGGSIADHLHTHVVPRWNGDTNFMAVVSDTTVIVEAVADTYENVHEAFLDQPGATLSESGAVRVEGRLDD